MSINSILAAGYITHSPAGEPLTTAQMATLKALAFCTGEYSNACFPAVQTLREMTAVSVNTIRVALKDLEAMGFITRTRRAGTSTVYTLQIDAMRAVHRRRRWTETRDSGNPYAGDHNAVTVVDEIPVEEQSVNVKRINFAEAPVEAPEPPATEPVPAPSTGDLAPIKTKKSSHARVESDFLDFYAVYPRHVGKEAARRAFVKAVKAGTPAAEIVEGARRYANATTAAGTETRYVAHPATWLNAGRWSDDMQDAAPVELTPWEKKTAVMVQSLQAAAVVNNAPALTGGAPATAPAAPLAIEPGYL
nr:MAG TPA: replisome organizer protein [Caudoviricetes sp.]